MFVFYIQFLLQILFYCNIKNWIYQRITKYLVQYSCREHVISEYYYSMISIIINYYHEKNA